MKTRTKPSLYSELVDLVANSDPQGVVEFRLSPKTARRVEALINREKKNRITPSESEELNTYMHLSQIVMLAQARAHKILHGKRTRKNTRARS
jgi:hypothetical protein